MKPGEGFVRRVTLNNLKSFAPLLASPGESDRRQGEERAATTTNPALTDAERLFSGISVRSESKFRGRRSTKQRTPSTRPTAVAESAATEVLFAQIPRAGTRWSQANFSKKAFTEFFHGDTDGDLTLRHVDEAGQVGQREVQHPSTRLSKNNSFELRAAVGRNYPDAGPPIGVFVRLAARRFLYMLLFPGGRDYQAAADVLARHAEPRPSRMMKQAQIDSAVARSEWPNSPLWPVYDEALTAGI